MNCNKPLQLKSRTNKYTVIYNCAIISLFGYVFLSDFVNAVLHVGAFKPATALLTVLFSGLYIGLDWKNLVYKKVLIVSFSLTLLYILILKNEQSNYLYTPLFGFLLVQKPAVSLKAIDKIFIIQFVALFYEFVTRHHLYDKVTVGLFILKELDFDYESIMVETGFKCKGLFIGVLVATCFVINYSLINRNNIKKSFWAMVMSILINGRLAMIICGLVFLYNYYLKTNGYKTKFNYSYIIGIGIAIVLGGFVVATTSDSLAVQNLFRVFDTSEASNAGRIARYGLALNALSNYGFVDYLFGSKYELLDQWNRVVPPESDVLGMLLDIGIVGFGVVLVGLFFGWKSGKQPLFLPNMISYKFALLMSVISIIQYRHLSGNLRGLMFWFLLMLILYENNYKTNSVRR